MRRIIYSVKIIYFRYRSCVIVSKWQPNSNTTYNAKKPETLAVTVITLGEKIKGWLNQINKSNNEPFKPNSRLVWGRNVEC
jgi:hypothetical protein